MKADDTMRKRRILAAAAGQGLTMSAIARKLGVSKQYVSQIINRKKTNKQTEEKIAALLRMDREYLFGTEAVHEPGKEIRT